MEPSPCLSESSRVGMRPQPVAAAQMYPDHRDPEHQFPQVRATGGILADPAADVSNQDLSVSFR